MLEERVKLLNQAGLQAEYLPASSLHLEEPALEIGKEGGAALVPDDCQLDASQTVAFIEEVTFISYHLVMHLQLLTFIPYVLYRIMIYVIHAFFFTNMSFILSCRCFALFSRVISSSIHKADMLSSIMTLLFLC